MNTVEILSQGDEVITGQTVDTNAAWLSEQLVLLGFDVVRHNTVGDRVEDIQQAIQQASEHCDLLICSGGLGPTEDDLTAEAVAQISGSPLMFDEAALAVMKEMFVRLNRKMVKANEKQVWLPDNATRIDNYWGTAPGFFLQLNRALMAFLPGVPGEMKAMFEHGLKPVLLKEFELTPSKRVIFRTTGVGESNLQEIIGHFSFQHVTLSYRAMGREVQIKLMFSPLCCEAELERHCVRMKELLGQCVFAIEGWGNGPGGSLANIVARLLAEKHLSLACAESASGGQFIQLMGIPSEELNSVKKGYYFACQLDLIDMLDFSVDSAKEVNYFHLANTLRIKSKTDLALLITPFEKVNSKEGEVIAQSSQVYLVSESDQLCIDDQVTGSNGYCQHAISYTGLNFLRKWLLEYGP